MAYGPKPDDLIGQKFGKLTIIEYSHTKGGSRFVRCQCECGKVIVTQKHAVKSGHTVSCGCVRKGRVAHNKTHGMRDTPEYESWCSMRRRCKDTKNRQYPSYGGRGITVCERWESFTNFYADMGPRPSPSHSVGRIDNDGPYHPDNCRWETPKQQANNRRAPKKVPRPQSSLANLRKMTSEWGRQIWEISRQHQRAKPKICHNCGKEFMRATSKAKYCSQDCYRKARQHS